jgi:hypothetical protein
MQGQTLKVCLDLNKGEKLTIALTANKILTWIKDGFAMVLNFIMLLRLQMLYLKKTFARIIF